MGIFSGTQGQLTPQSMVGSGQNFELLRVLMHIIIICKYDKDEMKNSPEKVVTVFAIITLSVAMETRSDLVEFRTHPSSHVWHHYL